jgi:hypothetical protein
MDCRRRGSSSSFRTTHKWFDDASTRHVGGCDLDRLQAWQHAELWRQHACDTRVVAQVQLRQAVRQPAMHTAATLQDKECKSATPGKQCNQAELEHNHVHVSRMRIDAHIDARHLRCLVDSGDATKTMTDIVDDGYRYPLDARIVHDGHRYPADVRTAQCLCDAYAYSCHRADWYLPSIDQARFLAYMRLM